MNKQIIEAARDIVTWASIAQESKETVEREGDGREPEAAEMYVHAVKQLEYYIWKMKEEIAANESGGYFIEDDIFVIGEMK